MPLSRPLTLTPLSLGLLLASLPARAELPAPTPEARELLEITVSASPLGRTADDLVQPVTVLANESLASKRRGTIGATLEQELGVSSTDFGTGAGRPVIRGQSGPRVELLSNSLGTMDVSNLSPDHAVASNPLIARQIEILRGPATLLYGNSAIGGAVNVIDNRLPSFVTPGLNGQLEAFTGTVANERGVFGDINLGSGRHQLHADFTRTRADDYDIPGLADRDGDDGAGNGSLRNSFTRSDETALSFTLASEDGNSAGIALTRLESRYGLPGHGGHDHGGMPGAAEGSPFIDLEQTRIDTQLTRRNTWQGIESLRFRLGQARYRHTEFEAPGEAGTRFRNHETQGRAELVHAPRKGWRGVLGLQAGQRRFQSSGEEAYVNAGEQVATDSLGVFVIEERQTGLGKVELGLRLDQVSHDPSGDNPARRFTATSASAGLIHDLASDTHLKVSLSHAERAPALEELYADGPHLATETFERGNTRLRREQAQTLDIGIDHHAGRVDIEANVFYKQARDYIFLDVDTDAAGNAVRVDEDGVVEADGEFLSTRYAQTPATFIGYEAAVDIALLRQPAGQLGVRLFTDAVRGRFDDRANAPRQTPTRVGITLHGHYRDLAGNLGYTRYNRQDRVSLGESEAAGYDLLDADLTWRLPVSGRHLGRPELYVRGNNLLNAEVRRATSFIKDVAPAPGRGAVVGIRLPF